MPQITLQGRQYQYELRPSNVRKTLEINVNNNSEIIVYTPNKVNTVKLEEILVSKSKWILDQLDLYSDVLPVPEEYKFKENEKFWYRGRKYPLRVLISDKPKLKIYRGVFYLEVEHNAAKNEKKDLFANWYKSKATAYIENKVGEYAKKLNLTPKKIEHTRFKRKWGSCDPDGNLKFDWAIIMAPSKVIDYIIVHELCHMISLKHDAKFWNSVKSIYPDFEESEEWMRINSNILTF